jgi:hypothetical protein
MMRDPGERVFLSQRSAMLLLFLLLFCEASDLRAQVAVNNEGQTRPNKRLSTVSGRADPDDLVVSYEVQWERETHRLVTTCKLTPREVNTLTEKMRIQFAPLAKRISAADTQKYYDYTYGSVAMRPELEKVAAPIIREQLGDEQRASFKKDLDHRRKLRRGWVVDSLISMVNASIGLDSEQVEKLREALDRQYEPSWAMAALNYRPFDDIDARLHDSIKSLLYEDQHAAWDSALKYFNRAYSWRTTPNSLEDYLHAFRADLDICAAAHGSNLQRTLGLDATQVRKLQILTQSVREEIYERKLTARTKLADPTTRMVSPATSTAGRAAPGTMLVTHPRWQAHIVNVPIGEGKEKAVAAQQRFRRRQIARLAGTMVGRISSEVGLTGEQMRGVVDLLDRHFPLDTSEAGLHGRLGIAVGTIPQDEVAELLGPDKVWVWNIVYRGFLRDVRIPAKER